MVHHETNENEFSFHAQDLHDDLYTEQPVFQFKMIDLKWRTRTLFKGERQKRYFLLVDH